MKLIITLFYFLSSIQINEPIFKPLLKYGLVGLFLGMLTDFSIITCFLSSKRIIQTIIKSLQGKKIRIQYYYSYKFEHFYMREIFNQTIYGFSSHFLILYGTNEFLQTTWTKIALQVCFVWIELILFLMLILFIFVSFKKNLVS